MRPLLFPPNVLLLEPECGNIFFSSSLQSRRQLRPQSPWKSSAKDRGRLTETVSQDPKKNVINWRKTETGRGGVEVLKHSPCHWLLGVNMQMKERHFRRELLDCHLRHLLARAVAGRRTGGEQCRQPAEEPVWCRLRFLRQAVTGGECVAGGWA